MESLLVEPTQPAARKFSVDEFYRMAEAGIFRPKDLVRKAVHIHRLSEGHYQVTIQRHGKISPEDFPDVAIDLDQLF